ncbi:MAG: diaminopimelate epimerase [Longimicrobiales bacterium]|nr:diaminopimelate epimerase [Longimicrobiales bacterium]
MTKWPPRPRLAASFYKAHGLGNDYLVFEEGDDWWATEENVRAVCHPHRGVGSDGIVVLLDDSGRVAGGAVRERSPDLSASPSALAEGSEAGPGEPLEASVRVRLRMFNPDGREFERSGNGLRVLASYLMRLRPALREMDVEVGGARVRMVGRGRDGGVYDVSVDMGRAVTGPGAVGLDTGALDPHGRLAGPDGLPLELVPVSVGNPHAVVVCDDDQVTEERLASIGPFLATHDAFRHGTNVQLARPDGEAGCRALIWERGVGRTSASGTSACAVAVALVSRGMVRPGEVEVAMPGGSLRVTVTPELDVVLRGPVEEVMEGRVATGLLARLS